MNSIDQTDKIVDVVEPTDRVVETAIDTSAVDETKKKRGPRKKDVAESTNTNTDTPTAEIPTIKDTTTESNHPPANKTIEKGVTITCNERIPVYATSIPTNPVKHSIGVFTVVDGLEATGCMKIKDEHNVVVGWVRIEDIKKHMEG